MRTDLKPEEIRQEIQSSDFRFAIVDGIFSERELHDLRDELLGHWGWRYKNWVNRYLHNYEIDMKILDDLASSLQKPLSEVAGRPVRRVNQWAIMAHANTGVTPHADNGTLVVNIWVTPDECNLDPDSGGLIFYDVRRPADVMGPEHSVADLASAYIARHTRGRKAEVLYRCNRAVVFDAACFHASAPVKFADEGTHTKRINISMIFDDPELFRDRHERGMAAYAEKCR